MPDPPPAPLADPWPVTALPAFICFFGWGPKGRQCCPQPLGVGRARGAGHQGTAESPAWALCAATAPRLDSFGADCLPSQVTPHVFMSRFARLSYNDSPDNTLSNYCNNTLCLHALLDHLHLSQVFGIIHPAGKVSAASLLTPYWTKSRQTFVNGRLFQACNFSLAVISISKQD